MKQRYDSYKTSGIDWIGEIPSHWKYIPIKYFFYLKGRIGWQGLKADEFKDDGPHLVTGTDFENGRVNWDKCYRITEERFNEAPEIHVKEGDLLITKDGTVGKLAYIEDKPEKVSLNSHLLIIRPLKDFISNKYIFWYCHSKIFKDYSGLIQDGSIMASLSQEDFSNFRVLVPPLSEQEAIAVWLDEKCGEIDAAIAKVDREIELIEELKQSEISRVVTRGLNPNATLRPSGIDWIGDIPEHWSTVPLKHLVSYNDEVWPENTKKDLTIHYVEIGDVSQSEGIHNKTEYEFEKAPSRARRIAKKDDVIISTVRTYLKAIAKVSENGLTVSTGFMVLRPKNISSSYLGYITLENAFIQEIIAKSTGVSYPAINSSEIANIKIIVPPLSEQREIADYLDKKCAEIDGLKAKLRKKREALAEFRQSLISEVVTGKRKVV